MDRSRRSFVRVLGSAAAGIAAISSTGAGFGQMLKRLGGPAIPVASTTDPLTYLSAGQFSPLVGTSFLSKTSMGKRASFVLVDVKDITMKQNVSRGYTGESFSLLFDAGRGLPAEIYAFDNRFLGRFSVFVSPVGINGTRYEAVVNRIAK